MFQSMSRSVGAVLFLTATAALAADSPSSESAAKKKEPPSRISSNVDVHPTVALTNKEASELSFAAGRILKHVAQARHAFEEKKKDVAAGHIDQGLKLITIIDNLLPHTKVKTEIKSGDLVYNDEDDVTPRYLTIFDELERRDIISPIVQAKKEAERNPPPSQGKESTANKTHPALGIIRADIVYSTAKLDIQLARMMLNRAKRDLNDGKNDAADEALMALQSQGVLFVLEEIDLPLEEVGDNLKLAETELKEGKDEEAKAALNLAVDDLKRYEKLVGEKRGSEVKTLHQEIDKLTVELSKGNLSDADRQKHASRISEWWHTATNWMKGTKPH